MGKKRSPGLSRAKRTRLRHGIRSPDPQVREAAWAEYVKRDWEVAWRDRLDSLVLRVLEAEVVRTAEYDSGQQVTERRYLRITARPPELVCFDPDWPDVRACPGKDRIRRLLRWTVQKLELPMWAFSPPAAAAAEDLPGLDTLFTSSGQYTEPEPDIFQLFGGMDIPFPELERLQQEMRAGWMTEDPSPSEQFHYRFHAEYTSGEVQDAEFDGDSFCDEMLAPLFSRVRILTGISDEKLDW